MGSQQLSIFERIAAVAGVGEAAAVAGQDPARAGHGGAAPAPADRVYLERSAEISPCGRYRYELVRRWGAAPMVAFVMLNPSTADAIDDDPTIRRCEGFARAWGHGGLVVVNLFAWRATDPHELTLAHDRGEDVVGPETDARTLASIGRAAPTAGAPARDRDVSSVVAAWGNRGRFLDRDFAVQRMLAAAGVDLLAIRTTKAGAPEHPLYLPATLKPTPYAVPERSP